MVIMMNRFQAVAVVLFVLGSLFSGDESSAELTTQRIFSQSTAQQLGLVRTWFTQVNVSPFHDHVTQVTLHVSSERNDIVHEIQINGHRQFFSSRDLDAKGNRIGEAGVASMVADQVAAARRLKLNPEHFVRKAPEVTLFILTRYGKLSAVDGEYGRTFWSLPIGRRNYADFPPAVNEETVIIVNGSTIYAVDRFNGKLRWKRRLSAAPWAGPALSDTIAFVPLINGSIEGFRLDKPLKLPLVIRALGRATTRPTVALNTISWGTDRGYLYVGGALDARVRYRFKTKTELLAPTAFHGPNVLVAAASDGDIYAVEELDGEVLWRFTSGQDIHRAPVSIDDAIYLVTINGNMIRISADSGTRQWSTSGVKDFLAASESRVYAMGNFGKLLVVDAQNGKIIDATDFPNADFSILNVLTDRIYLGSRSGIIQCLHEPQSALPVVHVQMPKKSDDSGQEDGTGSDDTGDADGGQEAASEESEEDPFGDDEGDDPFQEVDDDEGDDPF